MASILNITVVEKALFFIEDTVGARITITAGMCNSKQN
jgi:hypothetical protein